MKKHYDAVDIFKWICSWLVMYIHFAPVIDNLPGIDRIISQGICRVAVPFFFATSALLLFLKLDNPKTCKRKNLKTLLNFCGHILSLYTVWVIIYGAYDIFYNSYNNLPQKTLQEYFLGYFFSGLQVHLWYLIATVYAVPPVYLLWRSGRKGLLIGIVICELLCCLEWPYRFLPLFANPVWPNILQKYNLPFKTLFNGIPMMCIGILCLTDHRKYSPNQWLQRLVVAITLYMAEICGLYLYYGNRLVTGGMITRGLLTYYLVNWLFSIDFHFSSTWISKALRFGSTWNYCSHMLILMLFHWFFVYKGIKRFVMVSCLTIISSIPYIVIKLLLHEKKVKHLET